MGIYMSTRDFEILRTLVRVQLATPRAFEGVFFTTRRQARKRLSILRDARLVACHRNKLPQRDVVNGSGYWHITEQGLNRFVEKYPSERIPDNLVNRAARASLLFHEHRDAMTDCYMRLLTIGESDIETIKSRADNIDWRGEYEVLLPYSKLVGVKNESTRIVPDITLTTNEARYFLEVDRSTESGKRIREILSRYDSSFRQPGYNGMFSKKRKPCVLYITKSERRAENICKYIKSLSLSYDAYGMTERAATGFLNRAVNGEEKPTPIRRTIHPAQLKLEELYGVTRRLVADSERDIKNSPDGKVIQGVYEYLAQAKGV